MILAIIILCILGGLYLLVEVRYQNYIKSTLKAFINAVKFVIPTAKVFHIGKTTECEMRKVYLKHRDMLDFRIYYETHHEETNFFIGQNTKFNQFSNSFYIEKFKITIKQFVQGQEVYHDECIIDENSEIKISDSLTKLIEKYQATGIYKKIDENFRTDPI
jgi:hypothetical protein